MYVMGLRCKNDGKRSIQRWHRSDVHWSMLGFQSNDIFFSDNEMLTINYVIDPQHTLDYGQTVKVIIPVNLLYYGKSADETTTSQQYNVMSFFEFDIDIPGTQSRLLAANTCIVSLLCTIRLHSARACVCLQSARRRWVWSRATSATVRSRAARPSTAPPTAAMRASTAPRAGRQPCAARRSESTSTCR